MRIICIRASATITGKKEVVEDQKRRTLRIEIGTYKLFSAKIVLSESNFFLKISWTFEGNGLLQVKAFHLTKKPFKGISIGKWSIFSWINIMMWILSFAKTISNLQLVWSIKKQQLGTKVSNYKSRLWHK